MGTAKLGLDDGRTQDGTSVVDVNTKVYGTDNIFVIDASIWPGMPSTNPSALIVTASERASELIMALPYPSNSSTSESLTYTSTSTSSRETKSRSHIASHPHTASHSHIASHPHTASHSQIASKSQTASNPSMTA